MLDYCSNGNQVRSRIVAVSVRITKAQAESETTE